MSNVNPATTASSRPIIAFFGATGGCAGHALALSLRAGYHCTALVRNRTKLQTLLSSLDVSAEHLSNLTITEGDIHSPPAVSQTLQVQVANNNHHPKIVDLIISGLGSVPKFTPNPLRPTLVDPTICETGTRAILDCLSSLVNQDQAHDEKMERPLFVTISTTGVSSQTRDVPYLMMPLYHWMLAVPHQDKKAMEKILIDAVSDGGGGQAPPPIRGFVVVRPSLFTDGPALGKGRVKVGWEVAKRAGAEDENDGGGGEKGRPAIGYTISRADVGAWIFRELIDAGDHHGGDDDGQGQRERWRGRMVTLTY
ncbi:MAG: hypothetical protein M1816_000679 [Peltula sp. TS41687]|nr:MAG: hypothetical protein M1816_000679 [Peltula sp. TS41687]